MVGARRPAWRIGADAKVTFPALVRRLKDKNEQVRRMAAQALGQFGPAAKEALPANRQATSTLVPNFMASDSM